MAGLSRLILKFRIFIILVILGITLFFGYFLKDIKINPDLTSYLPETDPFVKLARYIGDEYGGNLLAIIALETDDVFNYRTIQDISHLTNEFKHVPGVQYVMSLANILDIKSTEEGIEIVRLIDEYDLPVTEEELKTLKEYTLAKDIYKGIVSRDAQVTLIVCRLSSGGMEIARELREIVENSDLSEKYYFAGLPFQMLDVSDLVIKDIKLLIPFIIAVLIIVLWSSYRSLLLVLLPLVGVGFSTIWTIGLMGLLKVPLTIISNIIPVILIAVGSAYGIHIISKFQEEKPGQNTAVAISNCLSRVFIPVLLACVTTVIGFVSFIFGSYLTMIREFGIFTALGVFFAFINAMIFIPSMLAMLPAKLVIQENPSNREESFLTPLAKFVLKNRFLIVIISILIVIFFGLTISRIDRKVDFLDYFKADSRIKKTEELIIKEFGGSVPIQILINGDLQDPQVLNEVQKLTDFLNTLGEVNNPVSIIDYVKEMNYAIVGKKEIPDTPEKVANLFFLIEGEEAIAQFINADKTEGVLQATVKGLYTKNSADMMKQIEDYLMKHSTEHCHFQLTGTAKIYDRLDQSLLRSQLQSLIMAVVLIFLCLIFLVGSVSVAVAGLVPIGFTLITVFGFMGLVKIPLDVATVLVGSVSIGIGIDYTIHFINRLRQEVAYNKDIKGAILTTISTTGKPIVINMFTVMSGFLILIFANLIPLENFGILVSLTMLSSGFSALLILPSLMLVLKIKFNQIKKEV
ncbi:MAG: efflux RND transporter permease subunit [bacterium]